MTLEFSLNNNLATIEKLVNVLSKKFCLSQLPNARKGGLIGLAAVMVGFQNGTTEDPPQKLIDEIVRPILTCFQDPDSRVRYYACEALYNVIKVTKAKIAHLFLDIFDNLAKVIADLDISVRNGAEIIDKLLKDIVCEENIAEIKPFVTKLRDYLYTRNPFTRMFVISWIRLLDSIESNMIAHLPEILDGLLHCLYDSNEEVRATLLPTMSEFLNKIVSKQSKVESITMMKVMEVLARELQVSDHSTVKLAILEWFVKLRESHPDVVFSDYNLQQKLLNTLLETLSDNSDTVVKTTLKVLADFLSHDQAECTDLSENLTELNIKSKEEEINDLSNRKSPIRTSSTPLTGAPKSCKKVAISSTDVINIGIHSSNNIDKFMHSLYRLFRERENVFNERASFIIIHLCNLINAEIIYKSLAALLVEENHDLKFAYRLVQKLNEVLLTAKTLYSLRTKLRSINEENNQEASSLFLVLYNAWCHSPIATLSICFLSNNYRLACEIVTYLPQLDLTIDTLVEIDKLVQLIESPIFIAMRLKLLDTDNYYLVKALYSLLMILPQSESFKRLHNRLECVHTFVVSSQSKSLQSQTGSSSIKIAASQTQKDPIASAKESVMKKSQPSIEMMKHFQSIQRRHMK